MGASIAFHLAEAGVTRRARDRTRAPSARGRRPSRWAGSGPRSPTPNNVQLGLRSLRGLRALRRPSSASTSACARSATCSCAGPRPSWPRSEASVRLQNALGCDSRMITPAEAYELNPFLDPGSLLGASFSPAGRLRRTRPGGRRLRGGSRPAGGHDSAEHTEVLELATDADRCAPGQDPAGIASRADTVVITAGAWSTKLGAMLGVHLPVEAVRRQIGFTPQLDRPHPTVPFTLDLSTTLYFHNYRNGLLLGISNRDEDPGFCREFSYGWTRAFDAAAAVVAPSLVGQPLVGGWAGLYENTPDHNAMIGKAAVPGRALRHRVLRPRLPAGSGRRRDHPRPLPGPRSVHGPDGVQRRPVRHRRAADRGPHHLSPASPPLLPRKAAP